MRLAASGPWFPYNAQMLIRSVVLSALLLVATAAGAREFLIDPDSDIVGAVQVIRADFEDTLFKLARRYDVGIEDLRRANPGVDDWLPGEGTEIVIPSRYVLPAGPRRGIVINVPEHRLYYFPDDDGRRVITHPIGVGREGWTTPYGTTAVTRKAHLPTWYPPESVREEHAAAGDPLPAVVPPGPDNPLGEYAIYLDMPGYLVHGTNKPSGVGMRVSHGCIRLFPEDIASLFAMVEPGTPVRIVNQPYKLGWGEGGLYMEAHPPLVEETAEWTSTELTRLYVAATQEHRVDMRWRDAEAVMAEAVGLPEFVSVEGTITVADLGDDVSIGD
jgi:L,D-transpeptidase ErfK/SrfK